MKRIIIFCVIAILVFAHMATLVSYELGGLGGWANGIHSDDYFGIGWPFVHAIRTERIWILGGKPPESNIDYLPGPLTANLCIAFLVAGTTLFLVWRVIRELPRTNIRQLFALIASASVALGLMNVDFNWWRFYYCFEGLDGFVQSSSSWPGRLDDLPLWFRLSIATYTCTSFLAILQFGATAVRLLRSKSWGIDSAA